MTNGSSKVQLLKMSANCGQATFQRLTGPMTKFFEFGRKHTVREETINAVFGMNLIASTKPGENVRQSRSRGTHKGSARVRPKEETFSIDSIDIKQFLRTSERSLSPSNVEPFSHLHQHASPEPPILDGT